MTERPERPRQTSRRGSSAQTRAQWRATYDGTPYDELPWFDPGPSIGVQAAVEAGFLPSAGSVLDIGCGAGSNLLYLAQHGLEVHGIDLSPGAVAAARDRAARAGVPVDVREGDALDIDFPDESLDALVDNGCFHTLPLRRRHRYTAEVHRVLRPGGRFVLSWVAREHTGLRGPPHRPSLSEVTDLLEPRFLFVRTGFRPAAEGSGPAVYFAFLERRSQPYPPRR